MCINPRTLMVKGLQVQTACRKCWQCRSVIVNDWVGRCIAESKTCKAASFITLTYGDQMLIGSENSTTAAQVLTYKHARNWIKNLRRLGYRFRFLICGEFGAEKGRAHWHALLFWEDKVPPHVLQFRATDKSFWPYGLYWWDDFNEASARYVCKYVLKYGEESQGFMSWSKKPPIGAEYFRQLAEQYVDDGIIPQNAFYRFAESRHEDGRVREYHMNKTSQILFVRHFVAEWEKARGGPVHAWAGRHETKFIDETLDKYANVPVVEVIRPRTDYVGPIARDDPAVRVLYPPPPDYVETFDRGTRHWVADHDWKPRLFWTFNDKGGPAWRESIGRERNARFRRSLEAASRRVVYGGIPTKN